MSPRALITGGAGFIGSHLARALVGHGWRVHIIDDLSTGQRQNLAGLEGRAGFGASFASVLEHDVMEPLVAQTDVVFHLAAAVGVRLIVERPVHTIATNIKSTEVVLELAAKHVRPVLVASTSEVYGKLDAPKFSEDQDLLLGPTSKSRWCYAASKIIDEHLALAYARELALPVTVLRMFNTIGPHQTGQYGMVVPRFVRQALLGHPITVYGDGRQRRSFTWVGDVVDAMIALIQRVGSTDTRGVDVRVIAATNRDPEQAVRDHQLREDVYYRLNVISIRLPSSWHALSWRDIALRSTASTMLVQGCRKSWIACRRS